MKCPHCLDSFHDSWGGSGLGHDSKGHWLIRHQICPACGKIIVFLQVGDQWRQMVYPKAISRTPLSPDIPNEYAEDYKEACLVLSDSPKASAALSRRCLQHVLREKAKVKRGNLNDEIQEVIDSGNLPSELSDAVDAIRNIGNFAAHPIKSTSTGEIVPVEPGEAEWLLDILEGLFDFYFVAPAKTQKRKDALNKKLKEAGKPEMK